MTEAHCRRSFDDRHDRRRGATNRYVVTAVSSNGESVPSDSITAVVIRGRTPAAMD